MAFCKFSNNFLIKSKTEVDNSFIALFLPTLPPMVVKVYLYGLFLCENPNTEDNTLEGMAKVLNMSETDVVESFKILEAEKLVQILNIDELNIIFIEAPDFVSAKKFDKEKYASFNTQMQNLFLGVRMLTQTEFLEYYNVIENFKVEPDALLLIAKYSIETKGKTVGYTYINTIAKNWAAEGIKTVKDVNEKLLEQERALGKLKDVLAALKIFRIATIDERQTYIKWKKEFMLSDDAILFATKYAKYSFTKLDSNITKYSTMGLISEKEIESYEKIKKQLLELSKVVVRNLGQYYANNEPVIENYITPWINLGFSEDFIKVCSNMCFKHNIKTLEGMDEKMKAFYNKGILTLEALDEFNANNVARDAKIKEVLKAAALVREVTNFDRSMFNTWITSWGMNYDVILYVAELSKQTLNPMQYINKILKSYKEQGVNSVDEAKKIKVSTSMGESKNKKVNTTGVMQHTYSANELNSLFANLGEVNDD